MELKGIFNIKTDLEEEIVLNSFKQFLIENYQKFEMEVKTKDTMIKYKQEKIADKPFPTENQVKKEIKKEPKEVQGVIG